MEKIIEMQNIRKVFPGVVALDDVSFDLYTGEVHTLIGENGAGKSTLMKILSGVYEPSAGKIIISGKSYDKLSPKESHDLGISVIFQELSVIDKLSIAENLFVGKLPQKRRLGFIPTIDFSFMNRETEMLLKRVGLHVKPSELVENLSISQKQQVEIAKALAANAKIIIMDEPTSSLNQKEVEGLFTIIKRLRDEGVGIIYISHKLRELSEIGDRITILKDGKTVTTDKIGNITPEDVVSFMVGRELSNTYYNKDKSNILDTCIFEAKNVSRKDNKVKNVSFKLNAGEILGFSGLVGAGRTELMNVIFGAEKCSGGEFFLHNKKIEVKSPYHSIQNGIGMITENRRSTGFMENFEIWKNIIIARTLKVSKAQGTLGLIHKKQERDISDEYKKKMNVKCTSIDQMITQLSGGNQQKVIIAKWLAAESHVLIFDEPTRGIDVGAKSEIYKVMRALANEGRGLIMVSSELPELLTVCDRILVFSNGQIKASFSSEEATEEKIMLSATQGE